MNKTRDPWVCPLCGASATTTAQGRLMMVCRCRVDRRKKGET